MTNEELLNLAEEAMQNAYAPYSHFKVGAALEAEDGSVYTGCNIENSSFSVTCCAERTALFKAVSEGHRKFKRMAVVGGKDGIVKDYCYPCGVCRQALSEFTDIHFVLLLKNADGDIISTPLEDLLPDTFTL